MPFIPVPNGVKVEMRYTALGEQVENVFWVIRNSAGGTPVPLSAIADTFLAWWSENVRVLQNNNVTLREIYVTDQASATGGAYTLTPANSNTGMVATEPLPNSVTLCISLRTGQRGRSYRGRSFIIGLNEADVVLNNISEARRTSWLQVYDELVAVLDAAGTPLAVCSTWANGNVRAAGVLTPVETVTIVDSVVDSQRRRLPGRGR